ncbi:RES domain-containing protein [Granulicella sp. 5B5]|uniref:RES family NAD+ phosphorylase n=1 Tax=Granulicella sp. 5B5 TaxID=1617967 RepID=UPI0015F64A49|nr:RES family NAD+ phosphorylase [Granulicella sp. 5B5]QMV18692.1 RES domain-containing protein [Granulicella sp. 5B5]
MRVWRLVRERHATTAFSGEGARLFSGRWNSAGTSMVYTSLSLSLAVVEVFVHLNKSQAPDDMVSVAADLPIDATYMEEEKTAMLLRLPSDWRREGHRELQQIGDDWIASKQSLHLLVPSVAVRGEWNVLINPLHPDAKKTSIVATEPFHFDERMFK